MRLLTGIAISILLSNVVQADDFLDAYLDTRDLVQEISEASKAFKALTENWDGGASLEMERQLRNNVLGPLEAAMYEWFDAGMKFGGSDDNPYRQFMACYDLSDQLKLTTIQFIHFNGGRLAPEKLDLDAEPFLAGMDACEAAMKL